MVINWGGVWPVAVAAGIPSALVGVLIRRLNRRIDKRDVEKEAREAARLEHEMMLIKLSIASLSLGEATAEAVQRIPDAHCNGEMREALEFEREQTVRSLR